VKPKNTRGAELSLNVLNLGFRVFFLGAAIYSALAAFIWMLFYLFGLPSKPYDSSPVIWHAHEMIYGYGMAVVTGFLLTASRNWSGIQTLNGSGLGLLFLAWAMARLFALLPADVSYLAAGFDLVFCLGASVAVAYPVVRARLWRNLGVVAILFAITCSNLIFYLGLENKSDNLIRLGIYGGFWLILTLVLLMARRVFPMFIQNGVDYPVKLSNSLWLDRACLGLFLLFWIVDLSGVSKEASGLLAAVLFVLHFMRWKNWYTPGIWQKPLLWVLYLAYGFILLGFALKASEFYFDISPFLALHCFTLGGIGLVTIGMMARVALGHTGRSVKEPPSILFWIFTLITISAVIRVIGPILDPSHYIWWMGGSLTMWILGFSSFAVVYAPMLISQRADGQPG